MSAITSETPPASPTRNTSSTTLLRTSRKERLLFTVALALEVLFSAILAVGNRLPAGHDGLQYFMYQYYFLNDAAQTGQIAQWSSYVMHGTVAFPWYGYVASPVLAVALQLGRTVRFLPALDWFHLSFLFDNILLLSGSWLLVRRFYKHPETTFFVSVCIAGGAIWALQPWFNFHFYSAVPLLLHLIHRFLETGRWRFVALAGTLLALQTMGNLPYMIPMTTFVIAAYFAFYFLSNLGQPVVPWRAFRPSWRNLLVLLITGASIYLAYRVVSIGKSQIVNYSPGRNPDSTVPFDKFLVWGAQMDWRIWNELWLRGTNVLDFTLYFGIISVPLAVLGIFSFPRKTVPITLTALFILFLARGNPIIAAIPYYLWPGMKFYRHLSMTHVFVRLFLCMLAGFGFERFFFPEQTPIKRGWRTASLSLPCIVAAGALLLLAASTPFDQRLYNFLIDPILGYGFQNRAALLAALRPASLGIGSVAALGAFFVIVIRSDKLDVSRKQRRLIPLALALIVFDLYSLRLLTFLADTDDYTASNLFDYQPTPFLKKRAYDIYDPSFSRYTQLKHVSRLLNVPYPSINTVAFADELDSTFRVDYWLAPIDRLIRAYEQPPIEPSETPTGLTEFGNFYFPQNAPSTAKVTGIDPGRVQFFDSAFEAHSDAESADWVGDCAFTGDSLILQSSSSQSLPAATRPDLQSNHRLTLSYEVERFDANNLQLLVHNTSAQSAWMLYCDTWNPGWSASINGQTVPIRLADVAYKAVPLRSGDNHVEFHYSSLQFLCLAYFFALLAALWITAIFANALSLILRRRILL